MPSYDGVDGKVTGAPPSGKKGWADFQDQKPPMFSVGFYRQRANADTKTKGNPEPFEKQNGKRTGKD